jgi:hypothetical protein
VRSILVVGRQSCGTVQSQGPRADPRRLLRFLDDPERVRDVRRCLFCLGVSSAGMQEEAYLHMTYDLTMAVANAIAAVNTRMTFCYVSGAGTDSTERSRTMWARVKGKTENALLRMPFKAFMFRPGVHPAARRDQVEDPLYQRFYDVLWPVYPVLSLFPRWVTNTRTLGRAMIEVAASGYPKRILESEDINRVGNPPS